MSQDTTNEVILTKLGEITEAAIDWAVAFEEENSTEQWNLQNPTKAKSSVTARTTAASKLQDIRRLVKELHAL
jgi:hypothetical protein